MDYRTVDKEIARDLTLQLLQKPDSVINKNLLQNPGEIGVEVAKLYNAILENISK